MNTPNCTTPAPAPVNVTTLLTSTQARARALVHRYPSLAARCNGRVERAVVIASTPGAVLGMGEGVYTVQSDRAGHAPYQVDVSVHRCTCPDHARHAPEGIVCKHRLAVALAVGIGIDAPAEAAQAAQVAAENPPAPVDPPAPTKRQLESALAAATAVRLEAQFNFDQACADIRTGATLRTPASRAAVITLYRIMLHAEDYAVELCHTWAAAPATA